MTTRYNVLDFGAKGDGVTDDTHAIQLAINAAFKAGGGEVYVPPGTFIVSGTNADGGSLTLKSNVTLTGAGQDITTLQLARGTSYDIDGLVRTSSTSNTHDAGIKDLTLLGTSAYTSGTVNGFVTGAAAGSSAHASNITVSQVTLTGFTGNALQANAHVTDLVVSDSLALNNQGSGFVTRFDDQSTAKFYDNTASASGGDGFDLHYWGGKTLLYNNVANGSTGDGIVLEEVPSSQGSASLGGWISGGAVYENAGAGLVIRGFTGRVDGVSVYDNNEAGVRLEGTDHAVVTVSSIYNNGRANGDAQIVATGNTLADGQVVPADNSLTISYNTLSVSGEGNHSTTAVLDTDTSTPQYHHILGNIVQGLPDGIDVAGNLNAAQLAPNRLYGTAGPDTLIGSAASSDLYGGGGDDVLIGGTRNDRLEGGLSADTLTGGGGNDTFVYSHLADSTRLHLDVITDFSQTRDKLDLTALGIDRLGNGYNDTVALTYVAAEHRSYLTHLADNGREDFRLALDGDYRTRLTDSQFTVLHQGTAGDDTLSWLGTPDASAIYGGAGNDVLKGGHGDGHLDGGAGADILTGGGGADVFSYHQISDSFVNDRTGVTSTDLITDYSLDLGDAIDVSDLGFTGLGDGHNGTLALDLTDHVWRVQSLDADADGNRFSLSFTLANSLGLATSDAAKAFIFAPSIEASKYYLPYWTTTEGKDILTVGGGATVDGHGGDDTLTAGVGDTVFIGGLGRDVLTGGSGSDTFRYTQSEDSYHGANDLITDFNPLKDQIDVAALGYTGLGNGHDGTLLVDYSADTGRTYVKDLDVNASGHRFEIGLAGDLAAAIKPSSFVFAGEGSAELTLLGVAHDSVTG
ncbi:glycosyl hydrolase family 28-related protein [Pseudomonas sp. MWU16-30317]|uniref:M10 family metallopeptidase C-terminal domain-containing protein n=1 Tax=Pseudomonas sp. MWU16-30317 TaxID=2878095 RepID=UPI0023DFD2FE|nr:glycosyl hydrolase family 28-related protein [Pseudomonas sp. MWU16-30317]